MSFNHFSSVLLNHFSPTNKIVSRGTQGISLCDNYILSSSEVTLRGFIQSPQSRSSQSPKTWSSSWNSEFAMEIQVYTSLNCLSAKLSDFRSLWPLSVHCVHVLKICYENNRIDDFLFKLFISF